MGNWPVIFDLLKRWKDSVIITGDIKQETYKTIVMVVEYASKKRPGRCYTERASCLELLGRRWGVVETDFITQLSETERVFDAIAMWADRLSRRVHFIPSNSTDTAEDVTHAFFTNIMPHHGLPDSLISDSDTKFTSKFWKELMQLCGVKLRMSSPRHPQTDGASEVMSRVLENYIRRYCEYKQRDWDTILPAHEIAYKSAVSEDSGMTPFELDLRWRPRDPLDILAEEKPKVQAIEDFAARLKRAFDDARNREALINSQKHGSPLNQGNLKRYQCIRRGQRLGTTKAM